MTLKFQVLAWDKQTNVAGLNWLVGSQHPRKQFRTFSQHIKKFQPHIMKTIPNIMT